MRDFFKTLSNLLQPCLGYLVEILLGIQEELALALRRRRSPWGTAAWSLYRCEWVGRKVVGGGGWREWGKGVDVWLVKH